MRNRTVAARGDHGRRQVAGARRGAARRSRGRAARSRRSPCGRRDRRAGRARAASSCGSPPARTPARRPPRSSPISAAAGMPLPATSPIASASSPLVETRRRRTSRRRHGPRRARSGRSAGRRRLGQPFGQQRALERLRDPALALEQLGDLAALADELAVGADELVVELEDLLDQALLLVGQRARRSQPLAVGRGGDPEPAVGRRAAGVAAERERPERQPSSAADSRRASAACWDGSIRSASSTPRAAAEPLERLIGPAITPSARARPPARRPTARSIPRSRPPTTQKRIASSRTMAAASGA